MDFKKILVWIIGIVLIIQIGYYFYSKNKNNLEKLDVLIGQQKYSLWVADNSEKRSQGLQNITKLKDNQGMLFEFDSPQKISFWNKNTLIDLAVLWIENDSIIGIDKLDKQSGEDIITITSPDNIDRVIELKQNQIEKNNLQVGDKIEIK